MKIVIVSDTHGKDANLEKVLNRESPMDLLIHCGDIEGQEDYIRALAECPVCMVSGNNDFFSDLSREEELEIGERKVLVTHGHYYGVSLSLSRLIEEAQARNISVVMFGHTHRPVVHEEAGVIVVNPGSLSYPRQEKRQPSYVILTIDHKGNWEFEIRYLQS